MTPAHPPKPVFALSVGVVGHRPNRLPAEAAQKIAQEVASALDLIRAAAVAAHGRYAECFAPAREKLTLISPLAEGSDRLVAAEALRQGYALAAAIPFVAVDYEQDFADDVSKDEFRALLGAASEVLEFSGNRSEKGRSYEQAGLAVLDGSDILIAVWDGEPSAGRGGTTELVHEAARRGMPVVRISTLLDEPMRLHWREIAGPHTGAGYFDDHFHPSTHDSINHAVDRLVAPPQSEAERAKMADYLRETPRSYNASMQFPLLMALMGARLPQVADFRRKPLETKVDAVAGEVIATEPLVNAYVWADEVAVRFGQIFRGAIIANFSLSALATILAAISFAPPWSLFEILLLILLIINASIGQKKHWHQRWIEAREVAEFLRVAMLMYAVGSRAKLPFGQAPTWTIWYVRAQLREAGLRSAVLDRPGVVATNLSLLGFLTGQKNYHGSTAFRFRALNRRLEILGRWLFMTALALSSGIFATQVLGFEIGAQIKHWLLVVSAGLPAVAAAGYGIRLIGDFEGTAIRSTRMAAQLQDLINASEPGECDFRKLSEISHRAAHVMLGDVASWRLVIESRKLDVPG